MRAPVKRKLGRWCESGYGIGLEIQGSDATWDDGRFAGHVRTKGRRTLMFDVLTADGHLINSVRTTIDDAKRQLEKIAGVTVIVEDYEPATRSAV